MMFDPSRWYSLSIWLSKLKLGKLIFLAHSLFPVLLSNLHLHLFPGMDAVPSLVDLGALPWLFRLKKTLLLIAAGMIISKCNCSIHSRGQFPQTSYCFLFVLGSKLKFLTQILQHLKVWTLVTSSAPWRIGFSHLAHSLVLSGSYLLSSPEQATASAWSVLLWLPPLPPAIFA